VVLGDGSSTAPCQGYLGIGGSGPGFGFGFNASRTVKFCKTAYNAELYQRYFGTGVVRQYLIQQDPDLRKIVGNGYVVKQVSPAHVKAYKAKKAKTK